MALRISHDSIEFYSAEKNISHGGCCGATPRMDYENPTPRMDYENPTPRMDYQSHP